MESLQTIKHRIRGVQSISKITKAMELVAATKMRRSQEIAISSRPYAFAALEMLANLSQAEIQTISPPLAKRPILRTAIVVVSSDKGLAGSFNSAVFRAFEKFVKKEGMGSSLFSNSRELENSKSHKNHEYIAIGAKAAAYLEKRVSRVAQKFIRVGDFTTVGEVEPIAECLVRGFLNKTWDKVIVLSAHFKSALKQEVVERQLFPIDFESIKKTVHEIIPERGKYADLMKETGMQPFGATAKSGEKEYLIEPSPEVVLNTLIPQLITMEIYHIILEANASEHAARRVAMKNASDNAEGLASDLTVVYNKSRQAAITREIAEITAGAEALR